MASWGLWLFAHRVPVPDALLLGLVYKPFPKGRVWQIILASSCDEIIQKTEGL
jgi:hypothetical protein